MRVWSSVESKKKNHYAADGIAGIFGILFLALSGSVILALSGIFLKMSEEMGLFLCLLFTGLTVWLAFQLGRRLHRDSLLFCLDEQDRLYAVRVSMHVRYRRGFLGYSEMAVETQRRIEQLKNQMLKDQKIPFIAEQILGVERLKEKERGFTLVCRIRTGDGREYRQRWDVPGGYEQEEELMWQFRRRLMQREI